MVILPCIFEAFLLPANEVWGKVIFSVACVKNSVQRGSLPHFMMGTTPGPGTPRAVHAGRYGQQAGGMHPIGMQSCFLICVVFVRNGVVNSVPTDNRIADFCVHCRLQGKVIFSQASVSLFTIGLTAIWSLLGLVTARSTRILLECFLVSSYGKEES